MSTTTTHPVNLRSRYKRVAQALEPMGIQAVLTAPACCRTCAHAATSIDLSRPRIVATRIEPGFGNSRGIFDVVAPEGTVSYLDWNPGDMSEGDFLVAVVRALRAEGFDATIPYTDADCIKITARKEVNQ
jgi:hypothetical protein